MPSELEIDMAADAMRFEWEKHEIEVQRLGRPVGLSWRYLAQVALEASHRLRGKPTLTAPEIFQ